VCWKKTDTPKPGSTPQHSLWGSSAEVQQAWRQTGNQWPLHIRDVLLRSPARQKEPYVKFIVLIVVTYFCVNNRLFQTHILYLVHCSVHTCIYPVIFTCTSTSRKINHCIRNIQFGFIHLPQTKNIL
jgi:hypothetical protein